MALARVEIREQAGRARAAALSFGLAAAALLFGVAFLLIAIATAIADKLGWPLWAGFLIVAVLLSLAGFVSLASGRRQLRTFHAVPRKRSRHSRRIQNGSRSGCPPRRNEPDARASWIRSCRCCRTR